MAADQLIDGRRPEDGTDFFSYAAGASPRVTQCDCRGVVVAGHADYAGARADRSRRQADVRIVCAVPRCPEPAVARHKLAPEPNGGQFETPPKNPRCVAPLLD